jgi:hypothetical protein
MFKLVCIRPTVADLRWGRRWQTQTATSTIVVTSTLLSNPLPGLGRACGRRILPLSLETAFRKRSRGLEAPLAPRFNTCV